MVGDYIFLGWIGGPYSGRMKEMLVHLLMKKKFLDETVKIQTAKLNLLEKKIKFNVEEHRALLVELETVLEKKAIMEMEMINLKLENRMLNEEPAYLKKKIQMLQRHMANGWVEGDGPSVGGPNVDSSTIDGLAVDGPTCGTTLCLKLEPPITAIAAAAPPLT
ncbi:conserved hypothetical protein [Ricinus communis]|uniref:Uncharacterized protein n=1 Tax=Ricinus communis TaxID=3988 RepID=B9S9P2_RICCO|nr:conserved hypothetical protein [Ricinus communis]